MSAVYAVRGDSHALGSLTTDDFHAIGMTITGAPVVDAIAAVCVAAPGIRTDADLPVITATIA